MAKLMDLFSQRKGQLRSPEELEQLAQRIDDARARENERLAELGGQIDAKLEALRTAGGQIAGLEERVALAVEEHSRAEGRLGSVQRLVGLLESLEQRTHSVESVASATEQRLEDLAQLSATAGERSDQLGALVERSAGAERLFAGIDARLAALEQADGKVEALFGRLERSENKGVTLSGRFEALLARIEGQEQALGRIEQRGKGLVGELETARATANSIEDSLAGMAKVKSIAGETHEHVHHLNSLAEHVHRKIQRLEDMQRTLDQADAQGRKMIQIAREVEERAKTLSEETALIKTSNDKVEVLRKIEGELTGRIERMLSESDAWAHRHEAVGQKVDASMALAQERMEHLSVLEREVSLADQRVVALREELRRHEAEMTSAEARGNEIVAASRTAEALLAQLGALEVRIHTVAEGQRQVQDSEDRLAQVADLAARLDRQMSDIAQRQTTVDAAKSTFEQVNAAAVETRGRLTELARQSQQVEVTARALAEFRSTGLQAEVRIKELTGRLAVVDAVEASLATVANLSAHLDRKVGDLEGRAALVDGVEARLSNLGTLSQEIGGRVDALLDQRRELESMRLTQDALALQLGDLQRLATMLQSSPRLGEMETQVRTLESSLLASLRRLNEVDNLNEALSEGELTLAALSERASVLATSIARQDGILTGVKESAERAEKSRSAWLEELARVESQHESAHEQLATTAQQIAAAEALVAKLEQARSGLESTEARIVEFQSRVSKLDESMGRLDRQTDLVESRTGMIDHLKKEIETLLASTEEHRKKAMQVVSAKKDILEAKEHLIAVNAQAEQIDRRMEVIQRRLAAVEDIELKVDTLHNTLADIDVSVDAFGEQKAVIDHIAEKLSRIDFEIRRAESVTRALQEERELAWRIQQGLKSVRRTKEVDEGEASAPLVRMKADERRVEGTEKKA